MAAAQESIETAVNRIGKDLAGRSAGATPSLFQSKNWTDNLLRLAMKDSTFKVQLFRFVDVLPTLQSDAQIARIMEEYFSGIDLGSGLLAQGMSWLTASSFGTKLSAHSFKQQVEHMARSFIAGVTAEAALPVLKDLWIKKRGSSVDLLGEATVSEREATAYASRCLDSFNTLAHAATHWPSIPTLEHDHLGPLPRINLSLKISALYSQLDPIDPEGSYRAVAARLRPLVERAMQLPAGITIDMEQADLKSLLLAIVERLFSEPAFRAYPYAGVALQAYLRETPHDLEKLISWARQRSVPFSIRLVKGAYWDSDTVLYRQRGWPLPAFTHKSETDRHYEDLTTNLLRHTEFLRPAFGTHNLRSVAHVEAMAEHLGISPMAYEYQMIYGMAEPLQSSISGLGRRLRIYTPVGKLLPGMAYLVRRLLENTSNESFLRREYAEHESLDALLTSPIPTGHGASSPPPSIGATSSQPQEFRNEPHTDFSKAEARAAMMQALITVKARFGQRWAPKSCRPIAEDTHLVLVRNPASPDQLVGEVRTMAPSAIPSMIDTVAKAQSRWATVSIDTRASILKQAAALMRERRCELAGWEVFEVGKSWREADADIAEAIDFLEFYGREIRRIGPTKQLGHEPGELNRRMTIPRGLVGVIAPWNFPIAIPTGMIAAALATGNGVLFKPSERALITGLLLVDLLHQAGIPEDVLCCLPGGPLLGQALVEDPRVAMIVFTGSKPVGLQIIERAARITEQAHLIKRVVAEMGGKNAIIVDETADLDEAIQGVVTSFTSYQGQKCSACSRVIVLDSIHDLFVTRLCDAVSSLTLGPPELPESRLGPVIDERAQTTIRSYIEIGRQEGTVVYERSVPAEGYYVSPTVVTGIERHHRLAQEEVFGPILAVMRARDFQDALTLANSTAYALTGGLYSRSPKNIELATTQFDVGNLYINRGITGALVGRQPFGGHRLSGVGAKTGSEEYLQPRVPPASATLVA